MTDWRAVAAGLAAFFAAFLLAVAAAPPWLLAAGFPGGVVAGVRSGTVKRGAWTGFLVGVAAFLLAFALLAALVVSTDPEQARPGLGYSLVLFPILGAAYVVEAAVAGALGGLVG